MRSAARIAIVACLAITVLARVAGAAAKPILA
jgi:hypothetical protein